MLNQWVGLSDVDIRLLRRSVVRGGEDVSLGKIFGDTPPLPAQTPVQGFVVRSHDSLKHLSKKSL